MSTPLARLAIFALNNVTALPIVHMPVYAEVIAHLESPELAIVGDHSLDDAIVQALRADDKQNVLDVPTRDRLVSAIRQEIARLLGPNAATILTTPADFVSKIIERIRKASDSALLRSLDPIALKPALQTAIRAEAKRRSLTLQTIVIPPTKLWSFPLGVLGTDHTGYLSYDLSRLPANVLAKLAAAIDARRLDPAAVLDITISISPAGSSKAFDALSQNRFSDNAIVARIEMAQPDIPIAVENLGLPAMQDPSLEDWRLSPGSFATNPGSLVGADGCESILPANVALQEYYFYQVLRLTDFDPPVLPQNKDEVKLGIVNEYRVSWNPLGHSLGQILYSMPLAPGESVNLAVVDWTRRDEAQRAERTTVDEQLVHNEHRDRSISEAVNTAVNEYQHGSNFTGGIAGVLGSTVTAGIGVISGGTSAGIAGSLGGSTASTSGHREVTGNTVQKLSDNITQASSSQRELQSTVVVHSTQSEHEAIETRTIVNYNHSHALTILYYEVLRHFRVVTELTRQRPAVLVRIQTNWFDSPDFPVVYENILSNRTVLASALLDSRFAGAFDAVDRVSRGPFKILTDPFPKAGDPPPPPAFHFFTFNIRTGGFIRDLTEGKQKVDILASLLLEGGGQVGLLNAETSVTTDPINPCGTFRLDFSDNIFTARLNNNDAVPWDSIIGMNIAVAVFPTDETASRVSFTHIKVSGIDQFGVAGTIVDQSYESGNLVIKSVNEESHRQLILPTLRRIAPLGPPSFSPADQTDRDQCSTLIKHLNTHSVHYSRAIALSRDTYRRMDDLDAIKFQDPSTALDHVENRPLEVIGRYLAYPSSDQVWNKLINSKIKDTIDPDIATFNERLVTLPTRGVFAEAKLGHCNASERIDNTRFWDWQQSPIPHFASDIAPVTPVTPQPQQQNLSPTAFPSSIVNIVNPPAAPDPTGLASALKVLGTPNIFRDLSGSQEVASLLQTLVNDAVAVSKGGSGPAAGAGTAKPPAGPTALGSGASSTGTTGGASTPSATTTKSASATPTNVAAVNDLASGIRNQLPPDQADPLVSQLYQNAVDSTNAQDQAALSNVGLNTSADSNTIPASIRITFAGSFQCRLATDPAPTNATRADPNKSNSGWTFDYQEDPFDRIIRFQSPIQLRSALVDPFIPVMVTTVEVQPHSFVPGLDLPFQSIRKSPLLGAPVNFGEEAKFDTNAGGGITFEAVTGCKLTVGTFFTATPNTNPKLTGLTRNDDAVLEYMTTKPAAIVAANSMGNIVPPRQEVLLDSFRTDFYAKAFGYEERSAPCLTAIEFTADTPLEVVNFMRLFNWDWVLGLTFHRFDGDTLTGRFEGTLTGSPSPGGA